MKLNNFVVPALLVAWLSTAALAEQIPVRHIQLPLHRFMVTRSEDGNTIARGEFLQTAQGDEVSMRLTFHFIDGSIDDETTTYRQHGTFQLIRDHHIQMGPFFTRPIDFTVDAATQTATSLTKDKNGETRAESKHINLPDDLANGIVGTLLLNVQHNTTPFRVGMLAPVGGGRLIRLLISPENEQTVQLAGQTLKATVFRVHPELGGFVSLIARLLGLQPKDLTVWVLEGEEPAVAVIVGQLSGYGPVVSSELEGATLDQ